MNYNDQILENKTFNFSKQLVYNLALSICILLIGVLICVYGLGYKLFEVLSNSQAPVYVQGDLVVVKDKESYEVGDILYFTYEQMNVTHRLIATFEKDGKKYYVCHGDNVQSANSAISGTQDWELDSAYVKGVIEENGGNLDNLPSIKYPSNIQVLTEDQIGGIVVESFDSFGSIIKYIKKHYLLIITLVAGIWCLSTVVQNELDIKKSRRLF